MTDLALIGRSSSHFTRVARIFAFELGVPYEFRPVLDLTVTERSAYGENPALKIPVLVDARGSLFGTDNICRALARRSTKTLSIVMRGEDGDRAVANAEELTLHVMSSEVTLILAKAAGKPELVPPKVKHSIDNCLDWLDDNIQEVLTKLPRDRQLSFVETALYCLVTHLPFRDVLDVSRWRRLTTFADEFGRRESARATEYRFDKA